ncbi:hypothetical protein GFGA_1d1474 [Gluconobacter frateurii NBRC 103465]|nr:hypothetical protein GFGA_1d1474 [Gluconobacter frateurii NBRC 103465]
MHDSLLFCHLPRRNPHLLAISPKLKDLLYTPRYYRSHNYISRSIKEQNLARIHGLLYFGIHKKNIETVTGM